MSWRSVAGFAIFSAAFMGVWIAQYLSQVIVQVSHYAGTPALRSWEPKTKAAAKH